MVTSGNAPGNLQNNWVFCLYACPRLPTYAFGWDGIFNRATWAASFSPSSLEVHFSGTKSFKVSLKIAETRQI